MDIKKSAVKKCTIPVCNLNRLLVPFTQEEEAIHCRFVISYTEDAEHFYQLTSIFKHERRKTTVHLTCVEHGEIVSIIYEKYQMTFVTVAEGVKHLPHSQTIGLRLSISKVDPPRMHCKAFEITITIIGNQAKLCLVSVFMLTHERYPF